MLHAEPPICDATAQFETIKIRILGQAQQAAFVEGPFQPHSSIRFPRVR